MKFECEISNKPSSAGKKTLANQHHNGTYWNIFQATVRNITYNCTACTPIFVNLLVLHGLHKPKTVLHSVLCVRFDAYAWKTVIVTPAPTGLGALAAASTQCCVSFGLIKTTVYALLFSLCTQTRQQHIYFMSHPITTKLCTYLFRDTFCTCPTLQ